MKYRIKQYIDKNAKIRFVAQYKRLLIWFTVTWSFSRGIRECETFQEAELVLNNYRMSLISPVYFEVK